MLLHASARRTRRRIVIRLGIYHTAMLLISSILERHLLSGVRNLL